ncbi:MAG TPA: hypothetical protein VH816_15275 [Gaiellaceae bacterium]
MIRAVAVVVAVLAAVALAGCGGGSRLTKSEYEQRVTGIYRTLGVSFRRAGTGAPGLRRMKSALDRAADGLDALEPPRDAASDQRRLVESTRDYATQVDLVRASVDFGDPVTVASHLREVTAPLAIRRVLRDLRAKGYRIPVTVRAVR